MNIKQDFIPFTNSNRPGTLLSPTHITVHDTANTSPGATAAMHAIYVKGQDAQDQQVSWHYTIDDQEIIQHLPNHEVGWHAGKEGNKQSIGIELCVNQDGNFEKTRSIAIELIHSLAKELDIPVSHVVPHYYWTGKNCPAKLLADWTSFKFDLENEVENSVSPIVVHKLEVIVASLWVYDRPDWEAKYTTVSQGEVFTIKSEYIVDGLKMYQLKSGLYVTGSPKYVKLRN